MISIRGEHTYQFRGLSTDKKPVNDYIDNGSIFIEMDTSIIYTFDKKNKEWLVLDWNTAASQEEFDEFKEEVEEEIEKIKDYSDVKDVVGTYAELQAYDTTTLNINDVIEVLSDETKDNKNTYYKWDGSEFDYVGGVGPFYTKPESDGKYLTNVKYENLQLKKTLNGTDSVIVDIPTLKSDLGLNNVTNDRQIKGLANGTTENDILIFGSDGYTVKDSGKSFTNSVSDAQHASDLKIATEKAIRTELDTKQNKLAEGMEAYLTDLRASMPNVDDTTIKLTYAQIKTLKNNDQLIAGRTYLITDYSTMTIDSETQSAGHDFDIVLKANTTNSFETICSAHLRAGTNYFEEQYISQWILWYNFDNNTDLCSWVDNTCKGYIYRFIDEYNNDLSYDFKNIQFKRYKIASVTYPDNYSSLVGMYLGNKSPFGYTIDNNDFVWRYTFVRSDALTEDLSNKHLETGVIETSKYVKQITMGTTLSDSPYRGPLKLPNNVFITGMFMCDMTFGNQTHTNTIQVLNDFSYNYFGSMMRRNLIYVSDFNHNNNRECFEDNLIGSGTKKFCWNWLGDHTSHNIIQGCSELMVSSGLKYVNADSPNETFNNVSINSIYRNTTLGYSVKIENAIISDMGDISYSSFGTINCLSLNHSLIYQFDIIYALNLSITGRPMSSLEANRMVNVQITFDSSENSAIGWKFENASATTSSPLLLDFRNGIDILINNAVKFYNRHLYSINDTITAFSGQFSWSVLDKTNNFELKYVWEAVLDGLEPTGNIIASQLTKHEIVDRIDSNYKVPDDMLIDFIDSIDTSKDHSVETDSNVAYLKALPSGTIGLNVLEVGGYTEKSENLIVLNDVAETTDSGITYKCQNGVITIGGTASAILRIYIPIQPITSGTYSYNQFSKNAGHNVYLSDDTSATNTQLILTNSTTTPSATSITITTTMNYLYFYIGNENVITNYSFTPMLVSGSTVPTTWKEGFTGLRSAKASEIAVSGNLCQTPTYNGVMNNTVAKSIDFGNLPSGTYSISLNVSANPNNRTFVIYYYNNGSVVGNIISTMTGTGAKTYTFTLDNSIAYEDIRLGINTQSNDYSITLDSLMLTKGTTARTYIPYQTPITKQIPSAIYNNEYYGLGYDSTHYNKLDVINKDIEADYKQIIIDENTNITLSTTTSGKNRIVISASELKSEGNAKCDRLPYVKRSSAGQNIPYYDYESIEIYNGNIIFYCSATAEMTREQITTWLASNNITLLAELNNTQTIEVSSYLTDDFKSFTTNGNYTDIEFVNQYNADMPNTIDELVEYNS